MRNFLIIALILLILGNLYVLFFFELEKEVLEKEDVSGGFSLVPDVKMPDKKEVQTPEFFQVPQIQNSEKGTFYGDVISHSPVEAYGDKNGRSTNVHETLHRMHSYWRNQYVKQGHDRVNVFYCLNGNICVLNEPDIKKSDVGQYLPSILKFDRYKLYIESQHWEDVPLYIYDELVAYTWDAKCNVEDVNLNKYQGQWEDGVSACLEFSLYATALCMAVQEKDPEYWEKNKQFKMFTIWMLNEAYKTYISGYDLREFKWDKQDKLYLDFVNSDDAKKLREFMKENLDGDLHWLSQPYLISKAIFYEPYQTKTILRKSCSCCENSPLE